MRDRNEGQNLGFPASDYLFVLRDELCEGLHLFSAPSKVSRIAIPSWATLHVYSGCAA